MLYFNRQYTNFFSLRISHYEIKGSTNYLKFEIPSMGLSEVRNSIHGLSQILF